MKYIKFLYLIIVVLGCQVSEEAYSPYSTVEEKFMRGERVDNNKNLVVIPASVSKGWDIDFVQMAAHAHRFFSKDYTPDHFNTLHKDFLLRKEENDGSDPTTNAILYDMSFRMLMRYIVPNEPAHNDEARVYLDYLLGFEEIYTWKPVMDAYAIMKKECSAEERNIEVGFWR